jgi:hypothetical protein
LAAALAVLAAQEAACAPPDPADVFGYYFLQGPLAPWAAEIDAMHLSTVDMRNGALVTVPLWGLIRLKDMRRPDYRIPAARLDGRRLSFRTREVEGVAFAFDGEFVRLGNFPLDPPQGIVLQGRLRRLQEGRVVGEQDARFRYEPGD